MKSPVANIHMVKEELLNGLSAYRCPRSRGVFLPVGNYFRWLSAQPEPLPQLPDNLEVLESVDNSEVKVCPESGMFMTRYEVGKGFSFYLDRSPSGSVWFDDGEWEQLKARQFHDELHCIFTAHWQKEIREEERQERYRALLAEKLGEEVLVQVEGLKAKLADHEYKNMALAYLQSVMER